MNNTKLELLNNLRSLFHWNEDQKEPFPEGTFEDGYKEALLDVAERFDFLPMEIRKRD
jgi:hypothetical protein